MAKPTKEFLWRMEGMGYALKIVKEQGIEALEKEINMRGFWRTPLKMSKQEHDNFVLYVTQNMYHTMLTVVGMVLHDELGFAKKRLLKFKEKFDKLTMTAFDFDYAGQHYVTLEDYAVYLNEKANLGIDVARVAVCQEVSSEEKERKNMADVNGLIVAMRNAGFEDAAEWLEKKVS